MWLDNAGFCVFHVRLKPLLQRTISDGDRRANLGSMEVFMNIRTPLIAVIGALLAIVLHISEGHAQATRTWVSGVGDDANPCSRTAPCKTFAGAISKTLAGGEISVLDPGGYGAVTITKSISIVGVGQEASILAAATNGIIIKTAPSDIVSISGLQIEGANTALNGIRIIGGGLVSINDCFIRGVRGSPGAGINVQSSSTVRVHIRNSYIFGNLKGVDVVSPNNSVHVVIVENSTIDADLTSSLNVSGSNGIIMVSGSFIGGAITAASSGVVRSFGNNIMLSGSPTETVPLK